MAKTAKITLRCTPEEKSSIEKASKGNKTEYLLNLHRNNDSRVIDRQALKNLILAIFEKEYAERLIKKHGL